MSNTDLNQIEEEESNLGFESDEQDATELDSLFADESQDESGDKVAQLEKKIENIQKGVQKYFSEQGRKAKQVDEPKVAAEIKTVQTDDLSELFYAQVPQAELVQQDLQAIAEAKYGGSILKAWKGESWLQEKSKALSAEKAEEEVNKTKISKPSNGTAPSRVDVANTKPEDVESLKPEQKIEWLRAQARKERESTD